MGESKGNPFKYTESELKSRHVGKIIDHAGSGREKEEYKLKKATYSTEGVWEAFIVLRRSFTAILVDHTNKGIGGWVMQPLCNKCAQVMIDSFLVLRSRGENVEMPKEVVPVNAAPDEKIVELLDAADFGKMKAVSANVEIRWIFNNMKMAGVDKKTAPSPGAYTLLMELQNNAEQRRDFYKTMWPKLVTKEDAEAGGKLHDDGKETVKLIERLLEAAESE